MILSPLLWALQSGRAGGGEGAGQRSRVSAGRGGRGQVRSAHCDIQLIFFGFCRILNEFGFGFSQLVPQTLNVLLSAVF